MTTPSANLCLQLMYLQCCKYFVLLFLWKYCACMQAVWQDSVVFAGCRFFLSQYGFSYIAAYCIARIFSWIIWSLTPHSLSVSLSLSHTHTHTRRRTHTHIRTQSPPSQLTLPQRHLSLGKARWWMQVGGWYACAHFCVRLSVRMSTIKREWREIERGGEQYALYCVCVLFHSLPDLGLVFFLSTARIFHVLYCVVFQCLQYIRVCRDLPWRCYQQC